MSHFVCGRYSLSLNRPAVMGILNVTPDSFSDGGLYSDTARAVEQGQRLMEEGALMLDIGGESTRPGATPVGEIEELKRVIPVIEQLAGGPVPLSIDTRHPRVMKEALAAGASLVNDVNGLRAEGAVEVCAEAGAAVCIMHMQGDPLTMQINPTYGDVVNEVTTFLRDQAARAEAAGIPRHSIMLDPGFGFGKTKEHNLTLLRHLDQLATLGYPVLAGLSRKSVLGAIVGGKPSDRIVPSIVAGLAAVERGAWMLRVHDVKATLEALSVWQAIEEEALGA